MGKVMMINASPRAPKSNSKQYAQLFSEYCRLDTEYCEVKKTNHLTLCQMMGNYSDIVFAFPLYVDGIPVTLLECVSKFILTEIMQVIYECRQGKQSPGTCVPACRSEWRRDETL